MSRKQKRKAQALALAAQPTGTGKKKAAAGGGVAAATVQDIAKRQKRAERFEAASTAATSDSWATPTVAQDEDWDKMVVRGTSQALEKGYLRLTMAPDAATVRPPSVLVAALAHVKARWEREHDYAWVCDQLKAIRQDLTVQHVNDEFAVTVYETHARWALESDDLNEFNQCQTQLLKLYAAGIGGARDEFTAYRILYYLYRELSSDLAKQLLRLTPAERTCEPIKHALQVCTAVALSNTQQFFHLHARAPHMSAYLLDYMVPAQRRHALRAICAAYRPAVPLTFLATALGFARSGDAALRQWLDEQGAVCDATQLQTKETQQALGGGAAT